MGVSIRSGGGPLKLRPTSFTRRPISGIKLRPRDSRRASARVLSHLLAQGNPESPANTAERGAANRQRRPTLYISGRPLGVGCSGFSLQQAGVLAMLRGGRGRIPCSRAAVFFSLVVATLNAGAWPTLPLRPSSCLQRREDGLGPIAVCTIIELPTPSMHDCLLRRPLAQALVCSQRCGSTSLQTAVGRRFFGFYSGLHCY